MKILPTIHDHEVAINPIDQLKEKTTRRPTLQKPVLHTSFNIVRDVDFDWLWRNKPTKNRLYFYSKRSGKTFSKPTIVLLANKVKKNKKPRDFIEQFEYWDLMCLSAFASSVRSLFRSRRRIRGCRRSEILSFWKFKYYLPYNAFFSLPFHFVKRNSKKDTRLMFVAVFSREQPNAK